MSEPDFWFTVEFPDHYKIFGSEIDAYRAANGTPAIVYRGQYGIELDGLQSRQDEEKYTN